MVTAFSADGYETVMSNEVGARGVAHTSDKEKGDGSMEPLKPLILMGLSFVGAVSLAIAHHFFYAGYDHRVVDDMTLSQEWLIRIGTGLAFITKTLFVLAASIAYTQHQWMIIKSNEFELRQIDIISGILQNLLGFFQTHLWLKHPLLTFLSAIAWLLQITAIFTPATITVVSQSQNSRTLTHPKQIWYNPVHFASYNTVDQVYIGPSHDIVRVAYASTVLGTVLSLPTGRDNSSYVLDFLGPALQCTPVTNQSLIASVHELWNETIRPYYGVGGGIRGKSSLAFWAFAAWVPDPSNPGNFVPNRTINNTPYLDFESKDAAHLYVMPNTTVINSDMYEDKSNHYSYEDLIDCALHNANYKVLFNLTSSSQNVTILSRKLLYGVYATTKSIQAADPRVNEDYSLMALCYQSVMQALNQILIGAELFLYAPKTYYTNWAMVKSVDWTNRDAASRGIEEVFSNITLSLMSSDLLTMNESLVAQYPVDTTLYERHNVYIYRANVLWISYGLAAGTTLLCMTLGVSAMIRNQACYENVPSTFFRVTANMVTLRQLVQPNDDGSAPLPVRIGKARVPAWNRFGDEKGTFTESEEVAIAETASSLGEHTSSTKGQYTIRRKPVPSANGTDCQG